MHFLFSWRRRLRSKRNTVEFQEPGLPQSSEASLPPEEATPLIEISDDTEFSSKIFQKLYWRVVPFVVLFISFSCLISGNVGFVAGDLCREYNFSDSEYGISASLFGVGYISSQISSNYFLRRVGANIWFAVLLIAWGTVETCFSLVKNKTQFYILRLLLGITSGGGFPGAWYYYSLFFPPDYLSFPSSTVEASASIASSLAPLAAALCIIIGSWIDVAGWKVLFVIEGVLPILYGFIVFFALSPNPEKASFLTQEQKQWLLSHQPQEEQKHDLLKEVGIVLSKPAFYALGANAFMRGTLASLVLNWVTLIVAQMTDKDADSHNCGSAATTIESVLMTAIPFVIAIVSSLWVGHKSIKSKNRPLTAGSLMILSGLLLFGFAIFIERVSLLALFFLGFSNAAYMALNNNLVSVANAIFHKDARATGIATFSSFFAIGLIGGSLLIGYIVQYQGYSVTAIVLGVMAVCTGSCLFFVKDPLAYNDP